MKSSWLTFLLAIPAAVILLVALSLGTSVYRKLKFSREDGKLRTCVKNCKDLAAALDVYYAKHHKRFPPRLELLVGGGILRELPICPAAGRMTYENYRASADAQAFNFSCCGDYHHLALLGFTGSSSNTPAYDFEGGLKDHP